jgi:hypothetical protein
MSFRQISALKRIISGEKIIIKKCIALAKGDECTFITPEGKEYLLSPEEL